MSNYSKKEALEFMKEKYKIAIAVKDYERAKEYFLKIKEIEDKNMVKPKCTICGKEMENAIDSKTKKISPYLWKTTCEHCKDLVLARG